MTIHQQLRDLRRKLRVSQAELAARAGLQRTHIVAIENARTDPQARTLEMLAHALDAQILLVPRTHVSAVRALIGEKPAATDRDAGSAFDDVFIPDPEEG